MNELVNIRPLALTDIAEIARWVAATPLWQRYRVTEASFARRLEDGLANGATIFVAERDDTVLGFVWLVARGAFNRSAYIQLIGVSPEARSGGVGRALMEFAEARAGSREMFLLVSDFNADAQKFYARLGYRQVGKLDDYVVQDVSELVFWKRIELDADKRGRTRIYLDEPSISRFVVGDIMKEELQKLIGYPIPKDGSNEFRHRQRIHQGWWRTFVLTEEPALLKDTPVCNRMDNGATTKGNFLTEAVRQTVQEALEKRDEFSSGMIDTRRLYNNLLSSQPMCFNLFGELSQDKTLALGILRNYLPGIEQVKQVMFEYAPQGYTGDNSAFDVAIEVTTKDGNGLLGLECKYTDDFSYKNKQGVVYGAPEYKNRARYEQIFYQSKCFLRQFNEYVEDRCVNQLFRNQLIAEALVQKHDYAFVTTGLVYRGGDDEARDSGLRFQSMLRDGEKRFHLITIQSFIGNAQRLDLDWETRVWTMLLWVRYCGNALSDNVANLIRENR